MKEAPLVVRDRVDPILSDETQAKMQRAALPLKNDFVFNFDAYESHRREIQEKHLQRNAARGEQIAEILNAKAEGDREGTSAMKQVTFAEDAMGGLNTQGQDLDKTLPGQSVLQTIEGNSHSL